MAHHPADDRNPPPDSSPDPALHPSESASARRHLRAFAEGLLLFDDLTLRRPYVVDSATGDPVCPVPAAVLSADQLTLHIPDEIDDALQLLVTPIEINPDREAAADRWRIYHGAPREARWARLEIQSGRRGRDVFDAPDLRLPALFQQDEARLIAPLNADLPALARACRSVAGSAPADPRAVGVDPDGLDIRARFGIIRIPFSPPADSPAAAQAFIQRLIDEARA